MQNFGGRSLESILAFHYIPLLYWHAVAIITVPKNIAKYGIATFRHILCLFREGNPHWMNCKILYAL